MLAMRRTNRSGIINALFGAVPAVLVAGSWSPAQAILTYYIYESGSDVVVKTSGTLTGLGTPDATTGACNINSNIATQIYAGFGIACTGASQTDNNVYTLAKTSGNYVWGIPTPDAAVTASSTSGFSTYIAGGDEVFGISPLYSGGEINTSATFANTSLSALGLGSYNIGDIVASFQFINNTAETVSVVIGAPPTASVPGPLPVLGAGAAFAWSRRLRSRIVSKAAAAVPQD